MFYKTKRAIEIFSELTPEELAVLCLSSDLDIPIIQDQEAHIRVNKDNVYLTLPILSVDNESTICMYSKESMVFGCLLAKIYAFSEGQIDRYNFKKALLHYTEDSLNFTSELPFTFERMKDLKFQIDQLQSYIQEMTDIDIGYSANDIIDRCINAMESLHKQELIIDPPWLKKVGGYGLGMVILIGSIPSDFSMRTEKGTEILKAIEIEAPLWNYKHIDDDKILETHFNCKIYDFVAENMANMAQMYLSGWSKRHPKIQQEAPSLKGRKIGSKSKKRKMK